jgi:hypothetical protein
MCSQRGIPLVFLVNVTGERVVSDINFPRPSLGMNIALLPYQLGRTRSSNVFGARDNADR